MKKQFYNELKIEVLFFAKEDVVTASVTSGTNDVEEGAQKDPFAFSD